MVTRVFPGPSDFENLSRVRTEVSGEANDFDYRDVVVRKPWGYEYLWFQTATVAVWMLHLSPKAGTSLHCHARKRTSLVVLRGRVRCATIDDRYELAAGSALVLEPCAFHSTTALSPDGAVVLEVESPPRKGDLVRLKDAFGRAGRSYEDVSQYSRELAGFDYRPLGRIDHGGRPFAFGEVSLRCGQVAGAGDFPMHPGANSLLIPLSGCLVFGPRLVAELAEAVALERIRSEECPAAIGPVEILQVIPAQSLC
ncbi:MAG TPA: hypothetical protein VG936_04285 [Lacunisphaera sp.]|nr:hypothetical protein [Lacunisphaera sp.]